MTDYVQHETSGLIVGFGSNPHPDNIITPDGLVTVYGKGDSDTHYVLGNVITQRAASSAQWDRDSIIADGIDECVLSGLPIPCTVQVDGQAVLVEDGTFEMSADVAGEYRVVLDEVAYLRQEWTVYAD